MIYNPFNLQDKTILVTGASSGIGRVIAIECSKMGANLVITGRNESRLQETLTLLHNQGHVSIISDLSDKEGLDDLIEQLPLLDGVVHCAAILKKLPLKFINEKAWQEMKTFLTEIFK